VLEKIVKERMLDTGYWMLSARMKLRQPADGDTALYLDTYILIYWILDTGYWILDTGYLILDT
jgi:hypothetical protein